MDAVSKVYDLSEVAQYLQDCLDIQEDTAVYFRIEEDGELAIVTTLDTDGGETEGKGFTEIKL